ncbi:meiotic recombination protein REC114 isoform X3 [Lissotriton helveticus]
MACGEGALPHVPLKETTECRSHLSLRSFEWTLRRYARFETSKAAPPDSDTPGSSANAATWKEGFSLIDSQKWLKIGKRTDCLLFSAKVKNESRMFRLQFSGMSKEQSLEHCSHCVQVLQAYIAVQEQEYGVVAQEGKLATNDSSHHAPSHSEVHTSVLSKSSASGGRMSVMQLAQGELPITWCRWKEEVEGRVYEVQAIEGDKMPVECRKIFVFTLLTIRGSCGIWSVTKDTKQG